MKHTKGKVILRQSHTFSNRINVCGIIDNEVIFTIESSDYITKDEAEANAEIIKDAFNTTSESGLTPSQLLKQRNELLEALKEMYNSANPINVIENKIYNGINLGQYYVGACGIPSDKAIHIANKAINNAKAK